MQTEVLHYGNIKFDVIEVKDYNKIGIIIKQPNEKNLSTWQLGIISAIWQLFLCQ